MTSYHHHSNGQKWNSARFKLILDLVLCAAHIQCNNREARTGCQSTLRNCSPPYSPLFISQHLLASTMLPGVNLTASVPQECNPCTTILVHCWLSSTMWPLYGLQLSAFFPRARLFKYLVPKAQIGCWIAYNCFFSMALVLENKQCWVKLLLKVMHYNIELLRCFKGSLKKVIWLHNLCYF